MQSTLLHRIQLLVIKCKKVFISYDSHAKLQNESSLKSGQFLNDGAFDGNFKAVKFPSIFPSITREKYPRVKLTNGTAFPPGNKRYIILKIVFFSR